MSTQTVCIHGCGGKTTPNAKFCGTCGKSQVVRNTYCINRRECKSIVPENCTFCETCGTDQKRWMKQSPCHQLCFTEPENKIVCHDTHCNHFALQEKPSEEEQDQLAKATEHAIGKLWVSVCVNLQQFDGDTIKRHPKIIKFLAMNYGDWKLR